MIAASESTERVPDTATVYIVMNALHGIAQEMGLNVLRTARSTIIREARDTSCALLDAGGRLVAEAEHIPMQMSTLALPLRSCLDKYPAGELRPGDVFLMNDPYGGGQHLQDLTLFLPVFFEGEVVAFSGSVAHHIDIGGGAAGLTFDAREIYQEGIRFPAMKVRESDFEEGGLVTNIVFGNFREPYTSIGDLRAQLSACFLGRARVIELVEKYSLGELRECIDRSLDYSERLMRGAIEQIPNGTYRSLDRVDSAVFSDTPIAIRLALEVRDDEVYLDFSETDPQTDDFLNVPFGSTMSAALSAIKMVVSSGGRAIPANEGCYRPIHVSVPFGSFLNPAMPAAVRARMCGAYRVFDCILMALGQAMPEAVPALGFNVNTTVGFSQRQGGRFRIFIEDIGGGWGATPKGDGQDMLDTPLSNCKITPIEVVELDHPYLRMVRFEYLPDSGGPGRYRGGIGCIREYEVLDDGVSFFAYADRHVFAPRGAAGGGDGTRGGFYRVSGSQSTQLPNKIGLGVLSGDRIQVVAGGGGGYGDPLQRASGDVEADVRLGKVTQLGAAAYEARDGC